MGVCGEAIGGCKVCGHHPLAHDECGCMVAVQTGPDAWRVCFCSHNASLDDDTRTFLHIDEVCRAVDLAHSPHNPPSNALRAEFKRRYLDTGKLTVVELGGYQYIRKAQAEALLGRRIVFWE